MTEGTFHVAMDLGGIRFNTTCDTLALAREAVESMDGPEGYSSHSATISEWSRRAVDGEPYLRLRERYWFGERVTTYAHPGDRVRPAKDLLDSDGPDYDPDLFVALVDA